jgi:WD40 repeat protein
MQWSVLAILLGFLPASAGAADAKVNYKDQVASIFQNRCNSCHNGDKQKGGLVLESYGGVMKGGGSGKVIEPGDSSGSRLFALVSHAEDPKMPPNQPKLPDAELETIKKWIEAGAPETSGSVVASNKSKLDFKLDPSAVGKPLGPPAMPEGVSTEPAVVGLRPNAITALAASPWAPLVAVSGHKQVVLYHTGSHRLVAVLPFPEGTVHCLKFTRDGGLLLAGGGRGGQSGRVVAWDVKTGKRLFEVGKEYDVVLAADISPDRSLVALGGPGKVLRVYGSGDGELIYEQKKHTEWVTAVEFSPDGVLLASGDRNGGLVVWEAQTGREFYDLRAHSASITDVSWRIDSNVLASSSEDTTVRLWEMQNGTHVKGWGAHGGGASSVKFAKDGSLVTTGRDHVPKLWDQNGGLKRPFEGFPDLALRAVFTHDDVMIVAGDWSGEVRLFDARDAKRLGNLSANPALLAVRLKQASEALAAAQSVADVASKALAVLQENVNACAHAIEKSQQALAAAKQTATTTATALAGAERTLAEKIERQGATADALWSAKYLESRVVGLQAGIDTLVIERADASRLAAMTAAATGTSLDRLLAERSAALLTATAKGAESALARMSGAVVASRSERAAHEQATAERGAVEAPLPGLRQSAAAAAGAVPVRQAELTAAIAAKTAANKAVAEKTPLVQGLIARAKALKEETDALAAEKQAQVTTKLGLVSEPAKP